MKIIQHKSKHIITNKHNNNLIPYHDGWYFIVVDGTGYWDEGTYDLRVTLTCNVSGCEC
jgi:hypothetical protein